MSTHFADRLLKAIGDKNAPACVGLDPQAEQLPDDVALPARTAAGAMDCAAGADAFVAFGRGIIALVSGFVPAVKINIAFFEPYGPAGIAAYFELVRAARTAGLIVIGDVKRADIGHSAERYALAQLSGRSGTDKPDAITINPYFGLDGVKPFVDVARAEGRGVFVLVQTSNASADQVQGMTLPDGLTMCQRVAVLVQEWATGDGLVGAGGYSCVGAVVSPRDIPSTERIRALMPNAMFLVPGFGAQGRTADEVARCFRPDGTGAIVTASRSVIFAHREPRYADRFGADWRKCVEQSCRDFVTDVRRVTQRP